MSPTYTTWCAMIDRCTNPNDSAWERYGGRGITVCDRWRSFDAFLADMGERPQGLTLDRENVNGNYERDNCRWATNAEQYRNTRRTVLVEHNGQSYTMSEFGRLIGMDHRMVRYYRVRGETTEQIAARAAKER